MPEEISSFIYKGVEYRILLVGSIDTRRHLVVWYKFQRSNVWEVGHSKELSDIQDAREAAGIMEQYIRHKLSFNDYNELLPKEVRR